MNLGQLQREWVSPVAQNGELQAQIWDRRAGEYQEKPLPDIRKNPFLSYLFEKAAPDKTMTALDIGCGAGLYSLALAPYIKEVVGTDISTQMILAASERAGQENIKNVRFLAGDWEHCNFSAPDYDHGFDIVFAHMTPAVCDFKTLEQMNACARKHCFLVKPTRRRDSIQDEAFRRVGITAHQKQFDDMISNTFTYLWLKGYQPELSYRDEIWHAGRTLEDMEAWCIDRAGLQKNLSAQEKDTIRQYLQSVTVDGNIDETITTTIVTMYWHV